MVVVRLQIAMLFVQIAITGRHCPSAGTAQLPLRSDAYAI
jgi:hypothetical protein